jgi:hypothetical protein
MALGKIKADQLEHSTAGSIATNFVVEGSAKAWANVDGTGTVALRDSFNVSTLTDSGTGTYKLTFSSNMNNDDYCPVASGNITLANSGRDVSCPRSTISTSEFDVGCFRSDNLAGEDFQFAMAQANGDLA